MAKFVKIAILAEFAGFVKIAASFVPLSRAQSLFGEIRQNRHSRRIRRVRQNRRFVGTPILSSIDLRQNFVKNRHSHRIRRICQNRRFVGTPISSSIALRRNSSKSPFLPNSPDLSKSPLSRYPYLELNRSSAKFVKIAIFPLILIFGEISSKLPNSPLRAFLDISQL